MLHNVSISNDETRFKHVLINNSWRLLLISSAHCRKAHTLTNINGFWIYAVFVQNPSVIRQYPPAIHYRSTIATFHWIPFIRRIWLQLLAIKLAQHISWRSHSGLWNSWAAPHEITHAHTYICAAVDINDLHITHGQWSPQARHPIPGVLFSQVNVIWRYGICLHFLLFLCQRILKWQVLTSSSDKSVAYWKYRLHYTTNHSFIK